MLPIKILSTFSPRTRDTDSYPGIIHVFWEESKLNARVDYDAQ